MGDTGARAAPAPDEIAHPLDAGPGGPDEALLGWGDDVGIIPAREGEPWPS